MHLADLRASAGSNVTPLAPHYFFIFFFCVIGLEGDSPRPAPLLSSFPLSPQPLAIFGPTFLFSQELQRRMRDGEIRSFEQIYDYIASAKFD
jgi:hypothetical protein